jgi:hypothetical protein
MRTSQLAAAQDDRSGLHQALVFSLSSAGGEGWGEEAVFPGGSWGGGALYLTNQANPPIGHCPGPVSQQLDEELDAPLTIDQTLGIGLDQACFICFISRIPTSPCSGAAWLAMLRGVFGAVNSKSPALAQCRGRSAAVLSRSASESERAAAGSKPCLPS